MKGRGFIFFATCAVLPALLGANEPVRFGRDVLPILSKHCSTCHGPDEKERKAKLRLDVEADAKARHETGIPIVPGHPDKSTVIQRLLSTDPRKVMPPPDAHEKVKPDEIELLQRWIAQGAAWSRHWSYEPIYKDRIRSRIPSDKSPIDALVIEQLSRKHLDLRPPAAPHLLIRRLYLDLIGLPPTPEKADQFAAAPDAGSYERIVDELLALPQFGEHWARMWLDLARYADTKGYEKDLGRTMWPYRDWVIKAFNNDMPLPQFTREQLAGDLLPDSGTDQLIATAFHRNTMENDEGGTDDEEYRVAAVKDRVDTTVQVWMGLTMSCAKCHTHKYDPISIAEYYGFYALFNQTQDADRGDSSPTMDIVLPEQQGRRDELSARVKSVEARVASLEAMGTTTTGASPWLINRPASAAANSAAVLTTQDDRAILVSGQLPDTDTYTVLLPLATGRHTVVRLEALPTAQGVGRSKADPNFVVSEITADWVDGTVTQRLAFSSAKADFAQNGWPVAAAIDGKPDTGWAVSPRKNERHAALFTLAKPLQVVRPAALRITLVQHYGQGLTLARFRLATSGAEASSLQPTDDAPELREARTELAQARADLKKFNDALPRLPILRELAAEQRRVTKIHARGNFLDQTSVVTAGVPAAFCAWPAGAPMNRLGVAAWLVSPDNPLTPRVWANRIWARLFGTGIVETEEDFGALGAAPSNQDLLDWLAAEYRDGGWSLKRLLKTIVMSDTYRQVSGATDSLRQVDPRNLLLSRGARFRLPAEVIRDQALATAGLLSIKMYGPPVMPPQPAGLWRSTYSGTKWIDAENEDRWRRGVYTYLKRTTPYPSFISFDGGSREVCMIRRINSNTPLQALVTLNDPVYVEAAAALAKRMVAEARDDEARATRGLRLALIRPVRNGETEPLVALKKDMWTAFSAAPEKADALLQSGRIVAPEGVSAAEMAAWVVTANAIMNLDEYLNRT